MSTFRVSGWNEAQLHCSLLGCGPPSLIGWTFLRVGRGSLVSRPLWLFFETDELRLGEKVKEGRRCHVHVRKEGRLAFLARLGGWARSVKTEQIGVAWKYQTMNILCTTSLTRVFYTRAVTKVT
jgi:hypothetical protein